MPATTDPARLAAAARIVRIALARKRLRDTAAPMPAPERKAA